MKKAKLYKLSNTIVSFIIGILAVYFIYLNLFERGTGFNWRKIFDVLISHYYIILTVFVLMLFNWGVEILKWNYLLKKVQILSVKQLIQSLCFGILLSLITPNRIGELGGRQLYIKKGNRVSSLYIQSFSAVSQLTVTILMGMFAILVIDEIWLVMKKPFSWIDNVIYLVIIIIAVFYLFSNQLNKLLNVVRFKFSKSEKEKILGISKSERLIVLFYSAVRFVLFSFQFILLFSIFESVQDYFLIFWSLSLTFLITAFIPTAWISDLLVRTSIIFYIFNLCLLNGKSAMLASLLLWIINLLTPAIFGLFSLNKVNWTSLKMWKIT